MPATNILTTTKPWEKRLIRPIVDTVSHVLVSFPALQIPQKVQLITLNAFASGSNLYLAVHIEELHSVLNAYERTIERGGQTLINVQRYTEFMHRVQELFRLPPPDLERFRHQGELAYLESQLADVRIGSAANDEVLAKAISLQTIEDGLLSGSTLGRLRLRFHIDE
jgi:hypothetical protein